MAVERRPDVPSREDLLVIHLDRRETGSRKKRGTCGALMNHRFALRQSKIIRNLPSFFFTKKGATDSIFSLVKPKSPLRAPSLINDT